ncbi:hypothetical protein KKC00_02225 [Patescibacteria group bacterium]|nr:hypothetical protein [Patescibacteria group bacterium]
MKKEEINSIVKGLNLPTGKYALFGSVPMAMRGIRECHDIDIILSDDLWQQYFNDETWRKEKKPSGKVCLVKDKIELMNYWFPGEWDIDRLIKEAEIINEAVCVRLEEVVKWKKIFNREKDRKDIKLIKQYNGN